MVTIDKNNPDKVVAITEITPMPIEEWEQYYTQLGHTVTYDFHNLGGATRTRMIATSPHAEACLRNLTSPSQEAEDRHMRNLWGGGKWPTLESRNYKRPATLRACYPYLLRKKLEGRLSTSEEATVGSMRCIKDGEMYYAGPPEIAQWLTIPVLTARAMLERYEGQNGYLDMTTNIAEEVGQRGHE